MSSDASRPCAAVLVDLESFYAARARRARESGADEPHDGAADLERLGGATAELARGRHVTVRRAYADFTVSRRSDADAAALARALHEAPRALVEQGFEPVQVFRAIGQGSPAMRLALDAVAIAGSRGAVGLVVLVAGDADLVPLVVELRRRGAEVVVVGVEGATRLPLQRAGDRFEWFDDLVAAHATHAAAGGDRGGSDRGTGRERVVTLVPHSPNLYQSLLRNGNPRIYVVPGPDWRVITAAVHDYCTDEKGHPRPIHHEDLVAAVTAVTERDGVDAADRKTSSVVFLLFKSGCFECAEEGAAPGTTDFHWSHLARLQPRFAVLEDLRRQGRRYVVDTLRQRLRAKSNTDDAPDPELLVELLEGVEPDAAGRAAIEELVAGTR